MRKKDFFNVKAACIAFLVFLCMNFLINGNYVGVGKLLEITGGHSILDMELMGYSSEKAYNILGALGEAGRTFYMRYIIPLDFPFPLSYGVFYFITLTVIAKSLFRNMKRPWLFGMIGAFATFFDWLENVAIIILLHNYPEHLNRIIKMASVFTQLKSLFIISSIFLIICGLITIIGKKIFNKMRG